MIVGFNHVTWSVTDIEESFRFYVDLLGFKPVMKADESAYFLAGDVWVAVVVGDRRDDDRYDHLAFQVSSEDFDVLVAELLDSGVEQWQSNSSEGKSFYFLDPSGNKFELHSSGLEARIQDGKRHWGADVRWYL